MQHVWIFVLAILLILFWRWQTWWRLSSDEKLRKQILQESKRVSRILDQIEEKEKELAIARRRVVHLLHRYRRRA